MTKCLAIALMVGGIAVSGCSFLDSIAGVGQSGGETTADPGGGIIGQAGRAVSGMPGWLGLVGTALGALTTLYQSVRVKRLNGVATAVVAGIDAATAGGTVLDLKKVDLYAAVNKAIESYAGKPDFAREFIARLKAELRA